MKKALIISLALHVITIAAFVTKRWYYSRQPVAAAPSAWSLTWDKQKNDLYSAVPINSGDVVFVGDSHVERFLLNDYFPGKRIRNRGIGSNTTSQVINRLPAILHCKPSKLFMQIGINDLAFGYAADTTYNRIVAILNMIDRYVTTPYVISLFPTTGSDKHLNDRVKEINIKLADHCIRENIAYINVYPELLKGAELNEDLTSDGTHLNGKGYSIWRKAIEKYVN